MQIKTKENLIFALQEDWERFHKPIIGLLLLLFVCVGLTLLFQRIDQALGAVHIKGYDQEELKPSFVENVEGSEISIPSIGVEAPIIFVESTDPQDFYDPLKEGVTHYPSAFPGEKGTVVILGHSAPFGILRSDFNGVFSDLNGLASGDEILVQHEGNVYSYEVEKQELLKRGQDIPKEAFVVNEARLLLLSCWPPGIDNKRIMVTAKSI